MRLECERSTTPFSPESYACCRTNVHARLDIRSKVHVSPIFRENFRRSACLRNPRRFRRRGYGASATSSGKFDTVARSSESAVDDQGKLPEASSKGNQALCDMPSIMRFNPRRGPFKQDFPENDPWKCPTLTLDLQVNEHCYAEVIF